MEVKKKVHAKGTENVFNKIIAADSPSLAIQV